MFKAATHHKIYLIQLFFSLISVEQHYEKYFLNKLLATLLRKLINNIFLMIQIETFFNKVRSHNKKKHIRIVDYLTNTL